VDALSPAVMLKCLGMISNTPAMVSAATSVSAA
jgi:hypothetical protein